MELKTHNSHKKIREIKRSPETQENNFWDCNVCTFRNTGKAFKCKMCESWKGTSSRRRKNCPGHLIELHNSVAPKPIKKDTVIVEADCEVVEDEKVNLKNTPRGQSTQTSRSIQKLDKVNGSTDLSCEETVVNAQQTIQKSSSVSVKQIEENSEPNAVNSTESKSTQVSKCITPRLENVDRSSAQTFEVTVRNISVLITEFKPLIKETDHSGEQRSEPLDESQS